MTKKIAVIILCFNNSDSIRKCLNSLESQSYKHFDLIIIDNNSQDKTLQIVRDLIYKSFLLKSKTKIITNTNNLGFAKGVNVGIKNIISLDEYKYIFILNPDTYLSKYVLGKAVEVFAQNSQLGAIAPVILYPNGTIWWNGTKVFSPKELVGGFQYSISKHSNKGGLINRSDKKYDQVEALSGCAMFIKTSVIKKVGIIDERFFMYTEDVDLSKRISKHNYKLGIYYGSPVYHEVKDNKITFSEFGSNLNKYRIYLTSVAKFIIKHYTVFVFIIWFLKLPVSLLAEYLSRSNGTTRNYN